MPLSVIHIHTCSPTECVKRRVSDTETWRTHQKWEDVCLGARPSGVSKQDYFTLDIKFKGSWGPVIAVANPSDTHGQSGDKVRAASVLRRVSTNTCVLSLTMKACTVHSCPCPRRQIFQQAWVFTFQNRHINCTCQPSLEDEWSNELAVNYTTFQSTVNSCPTTAFFTATPVTLASSVRRLFYKDKGLSTSPITRY
jgi:hypothetical protein